MKIVGGTFGTSGTAYIGKDDTLVIDGAKQRRFKGIEIASLDSRVEKEKKFGCFSFIVGAIILSAIFSLVIGPLGVVIGLILAGAGSFYANNTNVVELAFGTGDRVTLECTPRQVKKLVNLKP